MRRNFNADGFSSRSCPNPGFRGSCVPGAPTLGPVAAGLIRAPSAGWLGNQRAFLTSATWYVLMETDMVSAGMYVSGGVETMSDATRAWSVGRPDELVLLGTSLAAARSGETQIVLVEGEPGIGRPRCCDSACVARQTWPWWASGDPTESGIEFGAIKQLLTGVPGVLQWSAGWDSGCGRSCAGGRHQCPGGAGTGRGTSRR